MSRHLDPIALDRLALGMGTAEQRSGLETHLTTCGQCRERQRQHAEARAHFAQQIFAPTLARLAAGGRPARVARWSPWRWTVLWPLPPLLLALGGLALFLSPQPRGLTGTPEFRAKGQGRLRVFANRQAEIFSVPDGAVLVPGDAIRFVLEPARPGYEHLIIGSVDGAGNANLYFPYQGAGSTPIFPGGRFEVPGSIVLDDVVGPERVFVVFSRLPVSAADFRAALQGIAAGGADAIRTAQHLPLADTVQESLLFEKRAVRP